MSGIQIQHTADVSPRAHICEGVWINVGVHIGNNVSV